MMNNLTINTCTCKDKKNIIDGLNSYNLSKVAAIAPVWTPLEFVMKDTNGIDIGGILGGIGYWNGLEIKILWVKDMHRKQGIGTQLLKHIESMAIEKGAYTAMVDTFDFQAEGFYLKNGYQPIGEMTNFPKEHRRIYFSKTLNG